jgi:predicted nucleic acid-binding protein
MRYLLDVNVLLAFALREHELHGRVTKWMEPARLGEILPVATCAITELGFVRILSRVYGFAVADAKMLLRRLKAIPDLDFHFLSDEEGAEHLPRWVIRHDQVTDGHLRGLAAKHGARLATLDENIPDAFLIPN